VTAPGGRGIRSSTIGRRVAAIRYAHKLAGHAVPTDDERVKATVRGIRRTLGTAARKKAPATAERVIAMALGTGAGLKGLRDRALLLLGFAGAFRRSEIVALDCEDIEECETGLRITIRRGKTDQEGQGAILRGYVRDAEIFKDHVGRDCFDFGWRPQKSDIQFDGRSHGSVRHRCIAASERTRRGRDASRLAPPAQIRTCGFPA
jgi:hypothetical protein